MQSSCCDSPLPDLEMSSPNTPEPYTPPIVDDGSPDGDRSMFSPRPVVTWMGPRPGTTCSHCANIVSDAAHMTAKGRWRCKVPWEGPLPGALCPNCNSTVRDTQHMLKRRFECQQAQLLGESQVPRNLPENIPYRLRTTRRVPSRLVVECDEGDRNPRLVVQVGHDELHTGKRKLDMLEDGYNSEEDEDYVPNEDEEEDDDDDEDEDEEESDADMEGVVYDDEDDDADEDYIDDEEDEEDDDDDDDGEEEEVDEEEEAGEEEEGEAAGENTTLHPAQRNQIGEIPVTLQMGILDENSHHSMDGEVFV
jgi:hypothetical protein